mmetsp:Transcript_16015/g.50340  ORF Transcript_16015/g.50340 Transcript_16015/m.50340 type:complete len:349 (-) Transcript_16015:5243-6289(-)
MAGLDGHASAVVAVQRFALGTAPDPQGDVTARALQGRARDDLELARGPLGGGAGIEEHPARHARGPRIRGLDDQRAGGGGEGVAGGHEHVSSVRCARPASGDVHGAAVVAALVHRPPELVEHCRGGGARRAAVTVAVAAAVRGTRGDRHPASGLVVARAGVHEEVPAVAAVGVASDDVDSAAVLLVARGRRDAAAGRHFGAEGALGHAVEWEPLLVGGVGFLVGDHGVSAVKQHVAAAGGGDGGGDAHAAGEVHMPARVPVRGAGPRFHKDRATIDAGALAVPILVRAITNPERDVAAHTLGGMPRPNVHVARVAVARLASGDGELAGDTRGLVAVVGPVEGGGEPAE